MNRVVTSLLVFVLSSQLLWAQSQIPSFRSTNQKVVLLGLANEFVEPSVQETVENEIRRAVNQYSRTANRSSVSAYKLLNNPNDQYFRTVEGELGEAQRKFLTRATEDNQFEIAALGLIREAINGFELELQLYDSRIDTLSGIERITFVPANRNTAIEDVVYRTMNYIDRDGFVHPSPQDFLEKPSLLQGSVGSAVEPLGGAQGFIFEPKDLGGGRLAGEISTGGERTPFWERWWFWGLIFGGLATAGGLSYYFLVVDQPPTQANIRFELPSN